MKVLMGLLVLVPFIFIAGLIGLSIYGACLAFSASLILGVIVILVEPAPLVLGLVAVFGNPQVCQQIAAYLGLG